MRQLVFAVALILSTPFGIHAAPRITSQFKVIDATKPKFSTFMEWCTHRADLSIEESKTVSAILEQVETNDCKLASMKLEKIDKLEIGGDSKISDIAPLASLNIKELNLSGNRITDISHLDNIQGLQVLNLSYNKITDLKPLSSLYSLQKLSLNGNKIISVSPLASLNNLKEIELSFNQINDLSPLYGLNLTSIEFIKNSFDNASVKGLGDLKSYSKVNILLEESDRCEGGTICPIPAPLPVATTSEKNESNHLLEKFLLPLLFTCFGAIITALIRTSISSGRNRNAKGKKYLHGKFYPNSFHANNWYQIASQLNEIYMLDEALEAIERSILCNPGFLEAWKLKGQILIHKEEYTSAIECFKASLGVQKTSVEDPEVVCSEIENILQSDNSQENLQKYLESVS